jgi:hypothetical protein
VVGEALAQAGTAWHNLAKAIKTSPLTRALERFGKDCTALERLGDFTMK